jgi:hypothetical protein
LLKARLSRKNERRDADRFGRSVEFSDAAKIVIDELASVDQSLLADRLESVAFSHAACFPGGTLVLLSDGSSIAIEEIEESAVLKTFDTTRLIQQTEGVRSVRTAKATNLIVINGHLRTTPTQELFSNGAYRTASQLRLGELLVSDLQTPVVVSALTSSTSSEAIYCLTLRSSDGYYVRGREDDPWILVREASSGMKRWGE